jgi:hypothetical protein
MSDNESLKRARDLVQSFLKSKKILRIYPQNNPIYINTLEENHSKFKDFFCYSDKMNLHIKQNEIYFDSEPVYTSSEKEDNLALFFFKDGLREITFNKGLSLEELEDFLKIISQDFNREELDDDIVTLFWERDFQNIQYVVDDAVLVDEEDYEAEAVSEMQQKATDSGNLLKAYEDAFREENMVEDVSVAPLTDKDLQLLLREFETDAKDKTEKLMDILFEMLYLSETKEDYEDLVRFFLSAMEFSMTLESLHTVTNILGRLKTLSEEKNVREEIRKYAKKIIEFAGSEPVIDLLGEFLDNLQDTEEKSVEVFVKYLDRNAIVPFMKILGELKSITARKIVIEALITLGSKDIVTLARGLNDTRWYVVRNIIYILRKISDKRAVDYLLKTVRHGDIRVKREVIRALGELGGAGVIQALRDCLEDPEIQVRSDSLKALANVGSEAAKRIIMNKVLEKNFKDKDFEEKKEYFEYLSHWKDDEVFAFFVGALRKKTFLGRGKNFENRACAAFGLGLMGSRNALPLLNKYKNDSNKLLREFCNTAIKRLDYGK